MRLSGKGVCAEDSTARPAADAQVRRSRVEALQDEGNGTGVLFIDEAPSPAQVEALARIFSGQEGGRLTVRF